jgi:predicted metal-dependent hydrolase
LPFIEVRGHRIEYMVSRGRSARYTYLRFGSDMKLEVVVPKGRSVDVQAAIKNREGWIIKHFQRLSANHKIFEADTVMYEGSPFSIVFEKTLEKEELLLDTGERRVVVRASDRSRIPELMRRWFVRETSRYVVRKLAESTRGLSVKYRRADVRQMKNWGYCTRDGRLSFSWQLIALPENLREYVVMHELAHLKEFNHSAAFKRRLAELCPDYRARERSLDRIAPGSLTDYPD